MNQPAFQPRLNRPEGHLSKYLENMADPERFERPTPRFVVWCSIQLSYGSVVGR